MEFTLRPWRLSDAASLTAQADNIRVWNHVRDYFPHPYTERDGVAFIEMVLAKPAPATDLAIEIDGRAVGGIGIVPGRDVERITAEIGYWLGETYWGRGVMSDAVRQMADYAFANFEIRKLFASVFDFNRASQRVLEKAGFTREAILRSGAIKNGQIVDLHYYSLIR